jgi:hypothetical protein
MGNRGRFFLPKINDFLDEFKVILDSFPPLRRFLESHKIPFLRIEAFRKINMA